MYPWKDATSSTSHYQKHCVVQADIPGCASEGDYCNKANAVINDVTAAGSQIKHLSGGRTAYYNALTNDLVIEQSGAIQTYFRPGAGQTYVNNLS